MRASEIAAGAEAEARAPSAPGGPVVEAVDVVRRFGKTEALRGVSVGVRAGEIHALLGPNGAGKTTLLRILTGLVDPGGGRVRVHGRDREDLHARVYRSEIGLVPSGDRTFYLRISGLENLLFFARIHGMTPARARDRAWEVLRAVQLEEAARRPVGVYSHGMQKRLSVARALLSDPAILFVDEATHDLDPEGALRIQDLVRASAERGAAVLWATQRIDEIRGFASQVTLLHRGQVRFQGTVPELMALSVARRYLLHLASDDADGSLAERARRAVGDRAVIHESDELGRSHLVLGLREGVVLGDALSALMAAGLQILACREERSEIERAFLFLTGADGAEGSP